MTSVTKNRMGTRADVNEEAVAAVARHLSQRFVATGRTPVAAISSRMSFQPGFASDSKFAERAGRSERLVITPNGLELESRPRDAKDNDPDLRIRPVTDQDLDLWAADLISAWTTRAPMDLFTKRNKVEYVGPSYLDAACRGALAAFAGSRSASTKART